jgi:hypothetical protein
LTRSGDIASAAAADAAAVLLLLLPLAALVGLLSLFTGVVMCSLRG